MNERRVFNNIAEVVGWTPLVRLNGTVEGLGGEVFAKIEYLNPMGSVKDRIARYMVKKAIREGRLKQGDVIVESSSGNTAMGLAMMAVLEGLGCTMVVRRSTSKEKLDCLRGMGVELVLVDPDLPPDDPESYNRKAGIIARERENTFFPDQHNNRENNEAHYYTTGPEIWEQMDGRIDYFIAGIGTGGTICGAGKYLKERDPSIQVVAVDPVGSVFYEYFRTGRPGRPGNSLIEGLGDEEIIDCPEWEYIDDMLQVTDKEAFLAARELAHKEAILAGGSSGAALCGVRKIAEGIKGGARIVTLFPDSGSRYMSTIFNDDWMIEKGFMPPF